MDNWKQLHHLRVRLVNQILNQQEDRGIYDTLPEGVQRHISYGVYRHYLDHGGQESVIKGSLKEIYETYLHCWCCDIPLGSCTNYNEGEPTVIKWLIDPARNDGLKLIASILEN
ncbi:MAG: hypothetical protein JNK26_02595 [Candidatus Doudnabacteria bacterium]|nr:hypothetical protein [Candidatus Doudnabacteria bacterium]